MNEILLDKAITTWAYILSLVFTFVSGLVVGIFMIARV